MEGQYPSDMASLTVGGKYLATVPASKAPNYHPDTTAIINTTAPNDTAGWAYNNTTGDPNLGTVYVNCTHTDTKGTIWTAY